MQPILPSSMRHFKKVQILPKFKKILNHWKLICDIMYWVKILLWVSLHYIQSDLLNNTLLDIWWNIIPDQHVYQVTTQTKNMSDVDGIQPRRGVCGGGGGWRNSQRGRAYAIRSAKTGGNFKALVTRPRPSVNWLVHPRAGLLFCPGLSKIESNRRTMGSLRDRGRKRWNSRDSGLLSRGQMDTRGENLHCEAWRGWLNAD